MVTKLVLGNIDVDVILKDIKNVHLSVHPPHGRVRIAAPSRMKLDNIRLYAISKLDWIKTQQKQLREQKRETPREYLERESHYVWGKRYLLKVIEHDAPPAIELKHRNLIIRVRPATNQEKREQLLDDWYREQVKHETGLLIEKWRPILKVKVEGYYVQRMKTRWGSCNTNARTIRINSELGKKEPDCLEYIVVHEMVHLLERSHNDRFRRLMDKFYPKWSHVRIQLNLSPLAHVEWRY
jgi:predicted metal-dependent hydrolase